MIWQQNILKHMIGKSKERSLKMIRTEEYGMPNLGIGAIRKNEEKEQEKGLLYQMPLTFKIRLAASELAVSELPHP